MKGHTIVLVDLIKQYAQSGVGAEIGVYRGDTAHHILNATETQMLYMVDPYVRNYDLTDKTYSIRGDPDIDYEMVKQRFEAEFPGRHKLLREASEQTAQSLDVKLDFIFIDANHTYEHVLQDLKLWVPKVKSGGLVAGHDWSRKFPGVIIAVMEYASESGLFIMPENAAPLKPLPRNSVYMRAPWGNPLVMKSWPAAAVWWAIKR